MPSTPLKDLFGVKGYVAVVTGGTSGLGHMICKGLVQNGAIVYVVALPSEPIDECVTELNTLAKAASTEEDDSIGLAIGYACDVSSKANIAQLAAFVTAREHRLDLLVSNAGIRRDSPKACDVLSAPLAELQASIYATSKAATDHLVRLLAAKFSRFYVRVNSINPGFVPSKMNPVGAEGNMFSNLFDKMPAKRAGQEDDIFGAVIYLASRGGSYIDGINLCIDGGRVLLANGQA
ncbi:hypothetical protein SEPCBS119000_006430 [Sporothrix epigloea]|uniref:Uncharacterized protein n=1 Tax=Sporothrix epigloea TaxID=1892477 RepID=A0ABP0E2X4_9PEZI